MGTHQNNPILTADANSSSVGEEREGFKHVLHSLHVLPTESRNSFKYAITAQGIQLYCATSQRMEEIKPGKVLTRCCQLLWLHTQFGTLAHLAKRLSMTDHTAKCVQGCMRILLETPVTRQKTPGEWGVCATCLKRTNLDTLAIEKL